LQLSGVVARNRGDRKRATTLFRDSLALMRQVGDQWSLVLVLLNLGGLAQAEGKCEAARRAYLEGLALGWELKDRRGTACCLESLAGIATAQRRPRQAARLLGAAEELLGATGASWPPSRVVSRERTIAVIRAALGDEPSAAALAEGRAMTPEQAIACALEER
jgi:hypothetical protein